MRRFIIVLGLISISIYGLSCSKQNNINTESEIKQVTEETKNTEDKLGNNREDYYKYKSYKGIVKETNGSGLFNKVTLKEPLYAKGRVIDGGSVTRKLEEEAIDKEDNEEDKKELNRDLPIEEMDTREYLKRVRETIGSQLINNGYLLLYNNTQDGIFDSNYAVNRINTLNESLNHMNSTLQILMVNDEELIEKWNKLYEQLVINKSLVESLTGEYSIIECKNDMDLGSLLQSYSDFEYILNSYITVN